MVIAAAVGLGVWPPYALRVRAANAWPDGLAATGGGADARPEALATSGAVLCSRLDSAPERDRACQVAKVLRLERQRPLTKVVVDGIVCSNFRHFAT